MGSSNMQKNRRRRLIAVGAGVAVIAVTLASAAGLGGLVVQQIGAESAVVADPFTDGVTVTWGDPVYDATSKQYLVEDFSVARNGGEDIPAGDMRVTIADGDGAAITEATATTDGTSDEQAFSLATGIPVIDVENVSVVLHDLP